MQLPKLASLRRPDLCVAMAVEWATLPTECLGIVLGSLDHQKDLHAAMAVSAEWLVVGRGVFVGAMVPELQSSSSPVRRKAIQSLRRLGASVLAQHASDIVQMLAHPDAGMRGGALLALGMLAPADLAVHAGIIVRNLEHPNWQVRLPCLLLGRAPVSWHSQSRLLAVG